MGAKGYLYEKAGPLERLFYISFIPHNYWDVKLGQIEFEDCSYAPPKNAKLKVGADSQIGFYSALLESIKTDGNLRAWAGNLLIVASDPTEDMALATGFYLSTSLLRANPSAEICSLDLSMFFDVDRNRAPELVVIHNITSEATRERVQLCRDYIKWATRSALCVVCVGAANPLEVCYNLLRTPANMVLCGSHKVTNLQMEF